MKDPVVLKSLADKGIPLDTEHILPYEAMEMKPRVLDSAPKRLKLMIVEDKDVYGIRNEFIMTFNNNHDPNSLEVTRIDMKGNTRVCDNDVFYVLQALITEGICYSEEKAEACFNLFRIIMTTPCDVLSKSVLYPVLSSYKPKEFCEQQLLDGIMICLFKVGAPVFYWHDLCNLQGFYKNAVKLGDKVIEENCKTEKDVKTFLNPIYKKAKEDKEFMKSIYKQGANKWLIAMIYYLKDSNPEVMDASTNTDGFM